MMKKSDPNGKSDSAFERSESPNYDARAVSVSVCVERNKQWLSVDCADGRQMRVPLNWFPRLANGTPEQHARCQISGDGWFLHWPELDEDIEVKHLFWLEGS